MTSPLNLTGKTISYVTLTLVLLTSSLTSCSSDSNDEPDIPDTPESYILTPSTTASASLSGNGTNSKPYLIRNAPDFKRFIDDVNTGNLQATDPNYTGITCVKLTHDIEISSDYEWIPIGLPANPANLEFDGDNNEISGTMTITKNYGATTATTAITPAGLFGEVSCIHLSDLTVTANLTYNSNSYISLLIGTVAGNITGPSRLTNIKASGTLTYVRNSGLNLLCIGGLTGRTSSTVHENCEMTGKIEFNARPTYDRILQVSNIYIGGITGIAIESGHTSCVNRTDITINKSSALIMSVGGIVGSRQSRSNVEDQYRFDINDNYGNIIIDDIRRLGGELSESKLCAGGLFGDWAQNGGTKNTNHGSISITSTSLISYAGGIAGYCDMGEAAGVNEGNIDNRATSGYTGGCYGALICDATALTNTGNVNSTITVKSTEEFSDFVGATGGIAGYFIGEMSACHNSGAITSPEPFQALDTSISYAGALIGRGHSISGGSNLGTVNGTRLESETDVRIFNGFVWLPWMKISDGEIKEGSTEYKQWLYYINQCFPQYIY